MNKEQLQQLGHLIAGIITLVYGFDTFEAGDFLSATYYLSLAIIFLIVAGSHKWIIQNFLRADVAFFLVEAATISYLSWLYKIKEHPYLFYIMAVAGIMYFVFAITGLLFKSKQKHTSKRRKRRRQSSLFNEKSAGNDYEDNS